MSAVNVERTPPTPFSLSLCILAVLSFGFCCCFLRFCLFFCFLFYFIFKNFYCYSITVVCLFSPSLRPTPRDFVYFLERWEGKVTEGEKHQCARDTLICCLLHGPNWGPGPQPRHVPWLGIEPAAFQFTGWHSICWATPARALAVLSLTLQTHHALSHLCTKFLASFYSTSSLCLDISSLWKISGTYQSG